ncbi:MAG: leucyl/phenylalanyl-tRNA--protein transferase, partial [Gammaproteobacteria bacterium]
MIAQLGSDPEDFPPLEQALSRPDGLLAIGGDLSVPRLLAAYRRGIFPWYEEPEPILWWSPDPRAVLFPEELHLAASLRKQLRRGLFRVTADTAFTEVVAACAAPRPGASGTWIGPRMQRAYAALHRAGHAHSVEVWDAGT